MRTQFGRSMIEMLGVLAIIGVLSIGGIALYRRAVNNHHANTILDDVNRFAFVITEHGGYPEGEDIPKGDFKESGIYQLKGHQAYFGQYSITALNVPKGICEILIDKGIVDYKVGVVTAGESVENEILYDTLNTDICTHDLNDVAFYFGDVSGVCNTDENDKTECTTNTDCCRSTFCNFLHPTGNKDSEKGVGICENVNAPIPETKTIIVNGVESTWVKATRGYPRLNWWSAQNWCQAMGLKPATRADLGCGHVSWAHYCTKSAEEASIGGTSSGLGYDGSVLAVLQTTGWEKNCGYCYYWMEGMNEDNAWTIDFSSSAVGPPGKKDSYWALCH